MTPRTIVALLHFLERDLALERAEMFHTFRAAMHADEKQAEAFIKQLMETE